VPPLNEQQAIVGYLDHATSGIDALIAKTERSIELLHEHRRAVISAAVTGRIDTAGAAMKTA
jgi:type I restriction enzyme S subunit